jgi:membrane-bound lytic murein transglycosylase D
LKRSANAWGTVVLAGALATGCAHGQAAAPQTDPRPGATRGSLDATALLIREADARLQAGVAEYRDGHLNKAREEFDAAVDLYLTSPGGAYGNPRLAEAYRRTLEAIHVRELEALAAGDGFTEKQAEPASIDEVGDLAVPETAPSEETRRTAEAAVSQETNDLPILLNDTVLSCVDLYRGRLRDWFTTAMTRGGRYLPKIRRIFSEEGIPQDLAYVALVESAFKPSALSRAKARGVWQFIPSTGRLYGLQQDWWVDERSDPEKATRAAARYLKTLYEMFGDWNLALAGYNAGEGVVQRAVNRYRTRDFWQLSKTRGLRRETKNYVPLIHAAIVVAKAPEKYGFQIAPEPPLTFETVAVDGAVDLRVIAECAGAAVDDVQSLNPELRRLATPANTTFALKLPPGSASKVSDCLAELPADKRVHFRTHVVGRGQTLSTIASRYGARTQDVADANGLSLAKRLAVGTELIIPIDAKAMAPTSSPAVRRASQESAATYTDLPAETSGRVRIRYQIKPGDTLGAIAWQYGTTIENLKSWNGLRGARIAAGDTLTIYTSRKF